MKEKENVDETISTDGIHRERSPSGRVLLRKKSSIPSDNEIAIERKRSEIYRKISKVCAQELSEFCENFSKF